MPGKLGAFDGWLIDASCVCPHPTVISSAFSRKYGLEKHGSESGLAWSIQLWESHRIWAEEINAISSLFITFLTICFPFAKHSIGLRLTSTWLQLFPINCSQPSWDAWDSAGPGDRPSISSCKKKNSKPKPPGAPWPIKAARCLRHSWRVDPSPVVFPWCSRLIFDKSWVFWYVNDHYSIPLVN